MVIINTFLDGFSILNYMKTVIILCMLIIAVYFIIRNKCYLNFEEINKSHLVKKKLLAELEQEIQKSKDLSICLNREIACYQSLKREGTYLIKKREVLLLIRLNTKKSLYVGPGLYGSISSIDYR